MHIFFVISIFTFIIRCTIIEFDHFEENTTKIALNMYKQKNKLLHKSTTNIKLVYVQENN